MNKSSFIIWVSTIVAIAITFSAKAVIAKYDYQRGVEDTMRDAYENGVAIEYVTADNQVGLRWIETHKLGYE